MLLIIDTELPSLSLSNWLVFEFMLFLVCGDLPLGSDPAMTGARLVLSCLRILDRRKVEDPVAENKREIHAMRNLLL